MYGSLLKILTIQIFKIDLTLSSNLAFALTAKLKLYLTKTA